MNSSVSVATCAMSWDVHMICNVLLKEIALYRTLYPAAKYYVPKDENKLYRAVLIKSFERKCQTVLSAIMPSAIFEKYHEDITRHGP